MDVKDAIEFWIRRWSGYTSKRVRLDRRFYVSRGFFKEKVEIRRDDCYRAAAVSETHQSSMNWSRCSLGTDDLSYRLPNQTPFVFFSFKPPVLKVEMPKTTSFPSVMSIGRFVTVLAVSENAQPIEWMFDEFAG